MLRHITEDFGNGGTIDGDLTISGDLTVSGGGSLSFDEILEGTQVIDVTSTEAFLVRKNSDGGDIFTVDTTNSQITINGSADEKLMIKGSSNPYIALYEGTTRKSWIQWHSDGYMTLENNETGTTLKLADEITIEDAGSSSPILTIKDTNADDNMGALKFVKDSASPSTGDKLMQIWAYGDNNAGEQTLYSEIATLPTSVTDGSEEGSMRFRTMASGTLTEAMRIKGKNIGIGTDSPTSATGFNSPNLTIHGADPSLVISDSGQDNLQICTHGNAFKFINDSDDRAFFVIEENAPTNTLYLDNSGNVGIGVTPVAMHADNTLLQVGSLGTIFAQTASGTGKSFYIGQNVFRHTDGTWDTIVDDEQTLYEQNA